MTFTPSTFLAEGPARARPYPTFPLLAERVAVEAIITAWERVRTSETAQASPAKEVPITVRLQKELNQLLEAETVPGFTCSVFETVIRGGEVENAAGTSPERRPDLTFRLNGKNPAGTVREHYALFTECKVIDATHSVKNYCDTGVMRFVQSEYAWAMPRALMIAYARLPADLAGLRMTLTGDAMYMTVGDPVLTSTASCQALESRHARLIDDAASPNGTIELQHVWLPLDSASA